MNSPYQEQMPDYLQQQQNPSWSGAMNNMVRALLAGNDQYKKGLADQAAGAATAPANAPGNPLNINPAATALFSQPPKNFPTAPMGGFNSSNALF